MEANRRKFILGGLGALATSGLYTNNLTNIAHALSSSKEIKAIAFDAFPIFDPRAAFKVVKELFPEQGDALRKAWFNKIFGYTWLRTSGGKYKDFWNVMQDALEHTAESMNIDLSENSKKEIMNAFLQLPVWPDVKPALESLKSNNIKLAFLSNMTEEMLTANMKHNGIENYFDFVLSTDKAQEYKPSPKAYRLGTDAFGLKKEEVAFAAFAGWDAAGATWFGYPTVWVNRLGFVEEKLDASPAKTGKDLSVLTDFVLEK